jgi:hypothetical protein
MDGALIADLRESRLFAVPFKGYFSENDILRVTHYAALLSDGPKTIVQITVY